MIAFPVSCGEQFAAAGIDASLAHGLPERGDRFFLEEARENEQRIKRDPRKRGGFVGGTAERGIQRGLRGREQFFGEQTVFEPLKLGFLGGAKRRRRRGGHREARFGAEFSPD